MSQGLYTVKAQPESNYGTVITQEDFLANYEKNNKFSINITAMNDPSLGELGLLTMETEVNNFDGTGKLETSPLGAKFVLNGKTLREKNVFKVFDPERLNFNQDGGSVTVTEFGNSGAHIEAVNDIVADTIGEFTSVAGLHKGDTIKTIKSISKDSITIISKAKIIDIDETTKEIIFDTPITIAAGDYIKFMSGEIKGCELNDRKLSDVNLADGKQFTYYLQRFAETTELNVNDYDRTFTAQSYQIFKAKHFDIPAMKIYTDFARMLREGNGQSGLFPQIKGYDTICEEREADPSGNLKSIFDFSVNTTAEQYQKQLEDELFKVNGARNIVKSKMILLTNAAFHRAYTNMLQDIKTTRADDYKCCKLVDTLNDGIMKWDIKEAPMLDVYQSDALSEEYQYEGKAYVLPIDLIAIFTGQYSDVNFKNGSFKEEKTVFGTIKTFNTGVVSAECKTYEHYMKAGIIWGGVSFRDVFKRFDNFNYGL